MFIKIGASSLLRGVHKVGACVRFGASCGAPTRGAGDAARRHVRGGQGDSSQSVPSRSQ